MLLHLDLDVGPAFSATWNWSGEKWEKMQEKQITTTDYDQLMSGGDKDQGVRFIELLTGTHHI